MTVAALAPLGLWLLLTLLARRRDWGWVGTPPTRRVVMSRYATRRLTQIADAYAAQAAAVRAAAPAAQAFAEAYRR